MKAYTLETSIQRRSTKRLLEMLASAHKLTCECDAYHGFTCSKHERVRVVSGVLFDREIKTIRKST